MDGTIIGQGSFIVPAAGVANKVIELPSGVDWMVVRNYTRAGTIGGAAAQGFEYYWQRGMAAGTGMVKYYANAGAVVTGNTLTAGGFTLYDPSGQTAGALPLIGNAVSITGGTNATAPVFTTASTAGLATGVVVRIKGTAFTDINGVDFAVDNVIANTSFTPLTAFATAPGVVAGAGAAGFYSIINTNPLFYPRARFVVNITQAVNAQVSTSVAHGLTPGQEIRFNIPAVSGMIQLNSTQANNFRTATIVSVVNDYNFTINIDTTAYAAFTWPTSVPNQIPVSFPILTPVGENTANALVNLGAQVPSIGGSQIPNTNTGILADSTVNTGILGMVLGTGGTSGFGAVTISGPAGSAANDVVYWIAGKSSYGGL